ncbi:MAG: carboxymuconolactone decarboxylase family protein [Bacteroidales bacterium]|nr:carboxymuconolactone decarboxylase family protein [Bacteroidales bacterium]
MKKKSLVFTLISTLIMANNVINAQNPSQFRQPYPLGEKNTAFSQYFIGQSYLSLVSNNKNLNVPMFNVTFEPSCRNNWHKHAGGQMLIATAGVGYYQERNKPARRLYPGDVVEIEPNVEHWHGAAPDSWFAHIAVECNPQVKGGTTWLEPVEDAYYLKVCADAKAKYDKENTVLSEKQKAIVSMGNYTAQGNLYMLKQALEDALKAGITVNEVKELLVQAYAYCGFPRSLRAISTLDELLKERKAAGITENYGKESSDIQDKRDKYIRGAEILETLSGVSKDAPKASYAVLAPTIDTFLKEHLFCDIFERDAVSYKDRELFTVSMLTALGGVEPMAYGHMAMCLHIGITPQQLSALLNISEMNVGKFYSDPIREVLKSLTDK